MADLTIKPLTAQDKAEWQPLWQGYLTFYRSERPQEMYDLLWQRLLNDNPHDGSGLLARLDGKAVGIAHTYVQRHGWYENEVVYLQDLFATPEARGIGVGHRLLEAVYAAADDMGLHQVHWLTANDNRVARKLYDEIGQLTPFIQYVRPAEPNA